MSALPKVKNKDHDECELETAMRTKQNIGKLHSPGAKTIRELQDEIGQWTCETFGSDPMKEIVTLAHLKAELKELCAARADGIRANEAKELADVAILVLGYAHRREFNLADEIERKMTENRARDWKWDNKAKFFRHKKTGKKKKSV